VKYENTTLSEQFQNPIEKFIETEANSTSLTHIYRNSFVA